MLYKKEEKEMMNNITEGLEKMNSLADAKSLLHEIDNMIKEAAPDFANLLKVQRDFVQSQAEGYEFLESLGR